MPLLIDALTHRLGRRGAVLVMLGVVWALQGVAIATSPPRTEPGTEFLVHEMLPVWLRVVLWVGTGLVAVVYGFRQIPPGRDAPGFIALVILPLERAASFLWGFVLYLWHELNTHVAWLPWADTPEGYPRGLIGAATWGTVASLVMVIRGWADPRNRAVTHAPPGES